MESQQRHSAHAPQNPIYSSRSSLSDQEIKTKSYVIIIIIYMYIIYKDK